MGLRQRAADDLPLILEDDVSGFGWPITLTNPSRDTATLKGFTTDVSQTIDPETGLAVVARQATVALRMAALEEAGLGIPVGVADSESFPWIVEFNDIQGNPHKFKVSRSYPDRTLGIVTCDLEAYKS